MIKLALVGAGILLASVCSAGAQTRGPVAASSRTPQEQGWRAPGSIAQIPLWPDGLAIARPETNEPETVAVPGGSIAGRAVLEIDNVSRPTMAIYRAKGRNTGAAVMVFPGGGYRILAIDFEGTEVCDWLTAKGVTCIVLKYRVPQAWWGKRGQRAPKVQMALQDAQRAMGLLRERAKSLGVDPHRIGVLGFSAGGHLVTAISNAERRTYAPVDAADRESSRPDFAIALYPGHLWSNEGKGLQDRADPGLVRLAPWNTISPKAPPTLLIQAEDDPVDDVHNSIAYFLALRSVKVPVEMHIYAHGGHAFGMRPTAEPITHWPALAEQWLRTTKILR